jgi:hypothetical protein
MVVKVIKHQNIRNCLMPFPFQREMKNKLQKVKNTRQINLFIEVWLWRTYVPVEVSHWTKSISTFSSDLMINLSPQFLWFDVPSQKVLHREWRLLLAVHNEWELELQWKPEGGRTHTRSQQQHQKTKNTSTQHTSHLSLDYSCESRCLDLSGVFL